MHQLYRGSSVEALYSLGLYGFSNEISKSWLLVGVVVESLIVSFDEIGWHDHESVDQADSHAHQRELPITKLILMRVFAFQLIDELLYILLSPKEGDPAKDLFSHHSPKSVVELLHETQSPKGSICIVRP